jgi:uncharacterized protein DUF6205
VSDDNTFTGEITVTPALTAREIRALPLLHDVGLRIARTSTRTDDGESVIVTAPAITPPKEWGGNHITEDLQALADEFGAGHEFAGFIEMWTDPGYGPTPPKRFLIRDRQAVVVDARIVWPEGSE